MADPATVATTNSDKLAELKGMARDGLAQAQGIANDVRNNVADYVPAVVKDEYSEKMGWLQDFLPEPLSEYANGTTAAASLAGGFGLAVMGPAGAVMLGGLAIAAQKFMDGDHEGALSAAGTAFAGGIMGGAISSGLGDGMLGQTVGTIAGAFTAFIANDLLTGGGKTQELIAGAKSVMGFEGGPT